MSRIKQVIETLEAERADLRERLEWLDKQIKGLASNPSPLRRARLEANMSQRALAILASVSRDALSRAEGGDARVSLATWRRIAAALGVSVESVRPRADSSQGPPESVRSLAWRNVERRPQTVYRSG